MWKDYREYDVRLELAFYAELVVKNYKVFTPQLLPALRAYALRFKQGRDDPESYANAMLQSTRFLGALRGIVDQQQFESILFKYLDENQTKISTSVGEVRIA